MRPEVDDPEALPPGEHPEEEVLAAVRVLFPDAEFVSDIEKLAELVDGGMLVIDPGLIYSGKQGQNLLGKMNIGGETGECYRCNHAIESRVEVIWLDGELRNDCPESEDGAPHEVIPPEGWDEE